MADLAKARQVFERLLDATLSWDFAAKSGFRDAAVSNSQVRAHWCNQFDKALKAEATDDGMATHEECEALLQDIVGAFSLATCPQARECVLLRKAQQERDEWKRLAKAAHTSRFDVLCALRQEKREPRFHEGAFNVDCPACNGCFVVKVDRRGKLCRGLAGPSYGDSVTCPHCGHVLHAQAVAWNHDDLPTIVVLGAAVQADKAQPDTHRCGDLLARNSLLRCYEGGTWHIVERGPVVSINRLLGDITHCPWCGERLP